MRTLLTVASCATALGLAAFAQQTPPQPPQNPQNPQPVPQTPARPQEREIRIGADKRMTAQEAAEMCRMSQHSLTESIGIAERESGGKAIAAHCCMKSESEVKSWPAGKPDVRRGGTPSGTNEQKRDEQGRDTSDQSRTASGEKGPVCVVTCLVGDNRLVEIAVCSKSNKVLGERQVDAAGDITARTSIER